MPAVRLIYPLQHLGRRSQRGRRRRRSLPGHDFSGTRHRKRLRHDSHHESDEQGSAYGPGEHCRGVPTYVRSVSSTCRRCIAKAELSLLFPDGFWFAAGAGYFALVGGIVGLRRIGILGTSGESARVEDLVAHHQEDKVIDGAGKEKVVDAEAVNKPAAS